MDASREFFEKDAFGRHCGVEMLEAGNGSATAQLRLRPEHCNSMGGVHGAAIFTLADCAFAAASNSHDHAAVAININISYLKAVKEGILTAKAVEINRDGRIGNYTITITDEEGQVIALFEGLAYRKFNK